MSRLYASYIITLCNNTISSCMVDKVSKWNLNPESTPHGSFCCYVNLAEFWHIWIGEYTGICYDLPVLPEGILVHSLCWASPTRWKGTRQT